MGIVPIDLRVVQHVKNSFTHIGYTVWKKKKKPKRGGVEKTFRGPKTTLRVVDIQDNVTDKDECAREDLDLWYMTFLRLSNLLRSIYVGEKKIPWMASDPATPPPNRLPETRKQKFSMANGQVFQQRAADAANQSQHSWLIKGYQSDPSQFAGSTNLELS